MAEQQTPPTTEESPEETTVATEPEEEQPETAQAEEDGKSRLEQIVTIEDVGPCRKHIRVEIPRKIIDERMEEKISELMRDAIIPGFRKGKAPRRVIERHYLRDVTRQVKGQILLASLEQLSEDYKLDPITEPNFDPEKIEIPKQGPLIYEFEVEVWPEFELPDFAELKIKRPVREFTEEDVDQELKRLLAEFGQLVPKDGPVEIGDFVVIDMVTKEGEKVIGKVQEATLRVDKRIAFKDGVSEDFGEKIVGAKAGDKRQVTIKMSETVANPELAGKTLTAEVEIKDVKSLRLPELDEETLSMFGVESEEQLREIVKRSLERRLAYHQRQAARRQILEYVEEHTKLELPHDLLRRQARRAFQRRALEMQEAGLSEKEIEAQLRKMQTDILRSTAISLKEHFILQKVAEQEKIDVTEADVQQEIYSMALETGETPRRIRARLEQEGQIETLATLIVERKALQHILNQVAYEDVPLDKPSGDEVAVSEAQTVEGELRDPTQPPEEEETTSEVRQVEASETAESSAEDEGSQPQPQAAEAGETPESSETNEQSEQPK